MQHIEDFIESLYNLDRTDLRRLAWEALLISDGPDGIDGDVEGSIEVIVARKTMTVVIFDRSSDTDSEAKRHP